MAEPEGASRPTVLLVFGLPESGADAATRAIHAGGAALAADAETAEGRFAVSASLDRLAAEINAAVGVAEEPIGPVAQDPSPSAARREIATELRRRRAEATDAFTRVLPADLIGPVVIAASAMSAVPDFWLDALAQAGARAVAVLVHRNPLAIAHLARAGRGRRPRETIHEWRHLALAVLSAGGDSVAVLDSPDFDHGVLGVPLAAIPRADAVVRHPKDDADLSHAPALFDPSRELNALLDGWRTLGRRKRAKKIAELRRRFDEAVTLTDAARMTSAEPPLAPRPVARPAPEPIAPAPARSPLLFHYHIFKNAGTSVDRMLKANFGERWAEREFSETPPSRRHASIRAFLGERPGLQALSSHTAPLPEPELPDRDIVPILFVRHPLLRVRSAYLFERRQDATTRGAVLAKTTDLRGYVVAFLDDPKARQVRNFQAVRIAGGTPGRPAQERERALATLARLPFVGLVEAYDESVARLGALIRPLFPAFEPIALRENATAANPEASTGDRLTALREELGAELYDRLADANAIDLDLYQRVRARYATAR